MTEQVTIETIRAGQPRPYADSEDLYEVTVQRERQYGPDKGKLFPAKIETDKVVAAMSHLLGFRLKKDPEKWHERYLRSAEQIGEGRFRLLVIAEFTD